MKKIFKSKLFFFILGAVIFGGIGAVFSYSIIANSVGFTPKDTNWEVDNVEQALNELHTMTKEGFSNFKTPIYSSSYGNATSTRTGSIVLDKGKYIVTVSTGNNYRNSNNYPTSAGSTTGSISCKLASNCEINSISGYYNHIHPSSTDGGYYGYLDGSTYVFYVHIKSTSETLTYVYRLGWSHATVGQYVTFQAIPLN